MSDITPLRRWLPLSDAVKQIAERLGIPTEDARRALFNALRDEITQARGDFWDGSSDRSYLQNIALEMFLNEDIDWEKNEIEFDPPMQFNQISGGIFYAIYNIEVHAGNLDAWLKAHASREPAKSHDKGTDVTSEAARTTMPTPPGPGKGGRPPGPYLVRLKRFLSFLLEKKGPQYFSPDAGGIGAIMGDVRKRFKIDDPQNMWGLPKRTGLREQIKKWMHKNNLPS